MRQINSTSKEGTPPRAKKAEPLAEGIVIPISPGGQRMWNMASNGQIVAYAKRFMEQNNITAKKRLAVADPSLYQIIRKRGLFAEFNFESVFCWASMSDEQLISHTEQLMDKEGLKTKVDLLNSHAGLYVTLKKRNLLEQVDFTLQRTRWKLMSDEEVISYAKEFMRERGITGRGQLYHAAGGLCLALKCRGLFGRIPFEQKQNEQRVWALMSDEEVLSYAKKHIREKRITELSEFTKSDPGMYQVLRVRNLLHQLPLRTRCCWKWISDESLIEQAREALREKKITGRAELQRAEPKIYNALYLRKLLDAAFEGIAPKHRRYAIDQEELMRQVQQFLQENSISTRGELMKKDTKLYQVLVKRKLLDAVFSDLDAENRGKAMDIILDALSELSQ